MYVFFADHAALVHAPAKLNLFLEVLARRSDGFHEIETLMMAINLFDTLQLSSNGNGQIQLACRWQTGVTAKQRQIDCMLLGDLPEPSENIVFRVLERLRERAGVEAGADVQLVKRIPSAAGLGGASSDAAAAILAANHVWKLGWSRERLREFAAEFGSDIPFFVDGAVAAICRGRGESVQPVLRLGKLHVVVVRPTSGLSTSAVYARCRPPERPMQVQPLVDALVAGCVNRLARHMTNRLQDAAMQLAPQVKRIRSWFERLGCSSHQLSGSGTSYFGICHNVKHARAVSSRMRAANVGTVFCASSLTAPRRP